MIVLPEINGRNAVSTRPTHSRNVIWIHFAEDGEVTTAAEARTA
jgi:hypothetical protein